MTLQFFDCISPLTPDEFMSDYRGKRVVHFRGANTKYAFLMKSEELSAALSRLTVSSGMFRVLRPEGTVPVDELLTPPFAANRDRRGIRAAVLEEHLKNGATMALEHCESLFENVNEVCEMLTAAFVARANACLFVVYQAGKPSGLHWDDRDMFICQIAGKKKWPVYKPVYRNPLFDPKRAGGQVGSPEHFQDFILEAGDGLYIPRGWPHNPEGIEGPSVHLAFSIATPTGIDLLDWIRSDLNRMCVELREDLPLLASSSARKAYSARLRELIMEHLTDQAIDSYYQRHTLNVYKRSIRLPDFDELDTAAAGHAS